MFNKIKKKVKDLTLEEVDKVCDYAHELTERSCNLCCSECPFQDIKYGYSRFHWCPFDISLSDTNGLGEKIITIEEDERGYLFCELEDK